MYRRKRSRRKRKLFYKEKRKHKPLLLREDWLIAVGMVFFSVLVTAASFAWPHIDRGSDAGQSTEEVLIGEEINNPSSEKIQKEMERVDASARGQESNYKKQVLIWNGSQQTDMQEEDSAEPLIIIDPGHGGEDDGCVESGIKEKSVNLQIALLVKGKLEEKGFRVQLTRSGDTFMVKEERVAYANQSKADAFISIHQNTFEDSAICGIETWYDETGDSRESGRLAQLIHERTVDCTQAQERDVRGDAGFYVTGKTHMPACLIETGFLSNATEKKNLTDRIYQEKIAQGIAEGIDLFFHPKTMYLTFDDGPSAECTEMVLNILREKNVKATFFLIGEYVEKYPEVAKRIADEGHTIGIHCYRHDYGVLYQSVESYLEDFQKAYDVVREVTGVEVKLFRFPGGSVNAYNKEVCRDIIKEMTDRGYMYFDWNASLEDAAGSYEPEELLANARATAMDRKRVVLLAHDRVYNTALCLDRLITQFPEYKMEVLTPETEPIKFKLP